MFFNAVIKIGTSTCMIHNVSTSASWLLLLLLLLAINSTLSIIANINAHNSIITPSTTIVIEISMLNAIIPSIIVIIINTGIYRCRTVVTMITMTVVVSITTNTMVASNTLTIIITSTRPLLLLLLTVIEE